MLNGETDRDKPLRRAIEVAGSIAALAKAIGINRQAVSGWRRVPVERAPAVEMVTGIPRRELRPDFPWGSR